jgi:hypothetical protein
MPRPSLLPTVALAAASLLLPSLDFRTRARGPAMFPYGMTPTRRKSGWNPPGSIRHRRTPRQRAKDRARRGA